MPDIEFPTSAGTDPAIWQYPRPTAAPRRSSYRSGGVLTSTSAQSVTASPPRASSRWPPDLYRGESTAKPSEAEQKMMALSMDQAEQDMRGAVEFLASQREVQGPGVGALGFCLGGGLSLWAAAALR
jgi:carboxymethylenebutenolidase